ncbi:hypothetical protein ACFX2A_035808 [Malus domestica]
MRDKASSLPNVKLEQGKVTSLLEEKGTIKGVKFRRKGSQDFTAHAPLTIVCDGCCSNLRRYLCNPKVDIPSCFVGLILEDCQLPYANHAHAGKYLLFLVVNGSLLGNKGGTPGSSRTVYCFFGCH